MAQAWFTYHISQAYGQNGEAGIDFATPFHTPITALFPGTVNWAGRTQWRCGSSGGMVSIVCNVPGLGTETSYYLHLDQVLVHVGDTVKAGQTIGLSGGQLSGGSMPVVNCRPGVSGYNGNTVVYSTGAHMEFGFNAAWVSGPGRHVDPTFAINAARAGNLNLAYTPPPGSPPTSGIPGVPLSTGGTSGAAIGQIESSVLPIDASIQMLANLSAQTHHALNEYTGFESIAVGLQNAVTFPEWNYLNPFGSFFRIIKPWFIRLIFALIGIAILFFVLREYISKSVNYVKAVGGGQPMGGQGAAPGGGAGAAPSELAAAPEVAAL